MASGIADQLRCRTRDTAQEILERVVVDVVAESELDASANAAVGAPTKSIAMDLGTELQRVFAEGVGDMVDELEAGIGALNLGPVESPKLLREFVPTGDVDAGKAAVQRIGDARIEAVARGRPIVIVGESRLVQAVVAKARFVYQARAGDEGPVRAQNLGAGVNLGQPLRLQLLRVGNSAGIVSKEVASADHVAVADVVIDLYYGVVGADGVGQSIVDGGGPVRIGAVVRGKALAIAGNRRAQGAAADLQTHRTDGNAVALHVGEGVDDAGGRITGGIACARQRDGQRRGQRAGVADGVALPFVGSKEEHSILDDGAADAGPKLLEISRVLCLRRRIEVVAGVERCVAAESIGSSVHAVGPRLQAYVDNGSRFPAVLCGRILLEVELLDRIDR